AGGWGSIVAAASSLPASTAAWTLSRLTSLSLRANGEFLNPRLGSRRWSGIWPPSKPLMRTPERAVCPLPPRPPVLPQPEPIPRPTRWRLLRAPGLSASSCSFMTFPRSSPRHGRARPGPPRFSQRLGCPGPIRAFTPVFDGLCPGMTRLLCLAVVDPHQVLHLGEHAAGRRRVGDFSHAADAIEPEADQGLALGMMAADRAANLLNLDC